MKSMTTQQSMNVAGGTRGTQAGYEATTSTYAFIGMLSGGYTGFALATAPFGVPAAVFGAFAGQAIGYAGSAALHTVAISIADATDALFKPAPEATVTIKNAAIA